MAENILQKVVSLAKRRGFIFQSSDIYGGLKSAYDYGPLGAELKRNIANEWWKHLVYERDDVVGLDASIMMHPNVWQASGHLAGFSDPLVDCQNCKARFRADKAPQFAPGTEVAYNKVDEKGKKKEVKGLVTDAGYVCPECNCPILSDERQFNLMFRSSIGPVDAIDSLVAELKDKNLDKTTLREKINEIINRSAIYLRPETAQAMFVQFSNVQQSMSLKIPFGIAQIGKSFRNEITTEKFIFRTCEFEQMEMEYFIEPGNQDESLNYWKQARLEWWQNFINDKEALRLRQHEQDELAHYSDNCYDIEYQYPWGWDELEGVASRTDYDLKKHAEASGSNISYFDPIKEDPDTGKPGWRYTPYVIEPAAGLTRAVLMFLLDAYSEEKGVDAKGTEKTRTLLKLNPKLAPYKAAVLPIVKKDGLPEISQKLVSEFYSNGMSARLDIQQSIGKRYARHDEAGTPYCLTVDHDTKEDNCVTIRDRDTTKQERIPIADAIEVVKKRLADS